MQVLEAILAQRREACAQIELPRIELRQRGNQCCRDVAVPRCQGMDFLEQLRVRERGEQLESRVHAPVVASRFLHTRTSPQSGTCCNFCDRRFATTRSLRSIRCFAWFHAPRRSCGLLTRLRGILRNFFCENSVRAQNLSSYFCETEKRLNSFQNELGVKAYPARRR